MEVLQDSPREGEAIVRTRPAADLIENHQAARGRVAQDCGCLRHLDHERAALTSQVIVGTNTSEDPVYEPKPRPIGRHERADLRQKSYQCDLAEECALPSHVRA